MWRRREPASSSRMRGSVEKEGRLSFPLFLFSPPVFALLPVTKTSFGEAAVDAIELTRQCWWGEGDGWEQRDQLNRRVDELRLLKLSIYIDTEYVDGSLFFLSFLN